MENGEKGKVRVTEGKKTVEGENARSLRKKQARSAQLYPYLHNYPPAGKEFTEHDIRSAVFIKWHQMPPPLILPKLPAETPERERDRDRVMIR